MNLREKLASVRCEIRNIEKKGFNSAQNYKFMRAEDVAGDIGDKLAELKIVLARENLHYRFDLIEVQRKNGMAKDSHVIVTLDYVFLDGESDERIVVAAIGEGRDSGDKAVPKALTSALKYALTQPLMMRIGDDAEETAEHDKDSVSDDPFADAPPKSKPAPAAPKDPPVASAEQTKALWQMVKHSKGDKAESWLKNRFAEMKATKATLTVAQIKELTSMLQQPEDESQESQTDDALASFEAAQERANG